ncbi:secreted protein [Melampsora americana]|nr:secreted protein [Melampsora americana]
MFYTHLLICLGFVSLFQQAVEGQCLPLRGYAPINKQQCRKALSTYNFDGQGRLDSDGLENKKTCGNCKISLSIVSISPEAKPSLDGLVKVQLEAILKNLTQTCTYKSSKWNTMLPSIFVGQTLENNFVAMEVEVGDMRRNECSSTPRKTNRISLD